MKAFKINIWQESRTEIEHIIVQSLWFSIKVKQTWLLKYIIHTVSPLIEH